MISWNLIVRNCIVCYGLWKIRDPRRILNQDQGAHEV